MIVKSIEERFHVARNDSSLVVIEGFHPLKHAMRFNAEFIEIVSPDVKALQELQLQYAPDITDLLQGKVAEIDSEMFNVLARITPATGVMSIAKRPIVDVSGMLANKDKTPVVVLENPRNLFNIGAAVRAASAAGAAGLLNTGDLDPWKPAALTTGVGLQWSLPVSQVSAIPPNNRPLVAVDIGGESLENCSIPDRALLAFGTERQGLSRSVIDAADYHVSIPMEHGVSSLNLACSVAVILYKWKLQNPDMYQNNH
jgi:TrmH family RNA methyltransferase